MTPRSQLDRIESKVDRLYEVVIGDGLNDSLSKQVASLQEERGRRRWTVRLLIGSVVGLLGNWFWNFITSHK